MPKTPSLGLDQNIDKLFIDKYFGNVPMYLRRIPEARIYECNPEYMAIFDAFLYGNLDNRNISIELRRELAIVTEALAIYGKEPLINLDPFFECMGFQPQSPEINPFITVDTQYHGAVFWTADRKAFGVQPE